MSDQTVCDADEIVKPGIIIPLTQGFEAIIDEPDYDVISAYRWKILKAGPKKKLYACRTDAGHRNGDSTILMHRVIASAPDGVLVDHRNGNGLDNRRFNLRLCNQTQNSANQRSQGGSSRFKGVYWNSEKRLWQAQVGAGVSANGRQAVRFLGRYELEEDAALAYDRAAREIFGDFALTNFPADDGRSIVRAKSTFVPSGERNPSAKLSRPQAAEIKCRALAGENNSALAREFGISGALVGAIKRGKIWKDLP